MAEAARGRDLERIVEGDKKHPAILTSNIHSLTMRISIPNLYTGIQDMPALPLGGRLQRHAVASLCSKPRKHHHVPV